MREFKESWLERGCCVPIDMATTSALVRRATAMKAQLSAARYAYHRQMIHKYGVMMVLDPEEAAERYQKAMDNYDGIVDAAASENQEANIEDMAKGFVL